LKDPLDDVRASPPLEILLHWVRERERVRILKEDAGQPYPWTTDPIIGTYRFCNVRREDDRVTRWIQNHIRRPYIDHQNLWFMLCAARMINWPDTLNVLMSSGNLAWPVDAHFRPEIMAEVLEGLATWRKVFTGAYIIPAPHKGGTKGGFIAERVLGQLWRDRTKFESHFDGTRIGVGQPTLRNTHALLSSYDYWGPFLAYQAIVDMRFTPLLMGAEDVSTWCAAGPGTVRGLNRLAGRPLAYDPGQDAARAAIVGLWHGIVERSKVRMDLSDVPNVLCETDKYMRVLYNQGKPRARYVPGRAS